MAWKQQRRPTKHLVSRLTLTTYAHSHSIIHVTYTSSVHVPTDQVKLFMGKFLKSCSTVGQITALDLSYDIVILRIL